MASDTNNEPRKIRLKPGEQIRIEGSSFCRVSTKQLGSGDMQVVVSDGSPGPAVRLEPGQALVSHETPDSWGS